MKQHETLQLYKLHRQKTVTSLDSFQNNPLHAITLQLPQAAVLIEYQLYCLCLSSSDNIHTQVVYICFHKFNPHEQIKLTPAPRSPRRCCPWSWTGCWQGCRMKTTWPAGGSAGSEANAGGCCPASTDTGSFSGRSTQLEKAWTEFRFTCVKGVTDSKKKSSLCGRLFLIT